MPDLNRSMTTTATSGKVASGMDQALEKTLALTARRDDLLRPAVIDALFTKNARHVVCDAPDVSLKVQSRRNQMHVHSRPEIVIGAMLVDVFGNQPETRIQRMERIERVRPSLGLFLHPFDQQLEHFHRQATVTYTTQAQTKRFRRDVFPAPDREVVRRVGDTAGRVANGRIEHVQPFGTVVSAGHIWY